MARARRARKSASVRGGAALTSHALNVLRRAGIRYKQTRGGSIQNYQNNHSG